LEIWSIQQDNPKVLWPSKIANWRALLATSSEAESAKNPGKIDMTGPAGDYPGLSYPELGVIGSAAPAELNMLFNLFPKTATWRISEIRPGNSSDGRRFFDAFVSVTYPSIGDAPKIGVNSLAKTIVRFLMHGPPPFSVGNPSRIADADELASQSR
jgi:hypothetical protein